MGRMPLRRCWTPSRIVRTLECPHCCTFHVDGVFGEACYQARHNGRKCAHCGLLHEDYDLLAQVLANTWKILIVSSIFL
jgi:hypothetical protein